MRRRVSFGLLLLSSACTRVPADVSSPPTEVAAKAPAPVESRGDADPISSDCKSAELQTCAASCSDADCLEWCAGQSCATTIASLATCMEDVEQRFAAEHPAPQMDFETVTADDGMTYQQPTAESLEREYAWQDEHERALGEHWAERCEAECSRRLSPTDDDRSPFFCTDWRASYHAWARLTQPPPEPEEFGLFNLSASVGMFGALSLGSSMWLEGELAQRYDDPHTAALMHMISRAGWHLGDAESCVPNLDPSGSEFSIVVDLDPNGAVRATQVRDDPSGGECVANVVASALTLPVRVARDYPTLEIRVLVKPTPSFGLDGLGIDYGGLSGSGLGDYGDYGDVGDGYGTVGSGSGSGGGYGVGGGGSLDLGPGDLDPPQPPDDGN